MEDDVRVTVDSADDASLDHVVQLHCALFPNGFITSLGPKFLKLVFRHMVESRYGIMVLATAEVDGRGRPVAYVLAATDVRRLYRDFILRKSLRMVGIVARFLTSREV